MSVLSPVVMSRSPTDSGVTGMAKDHPAMQTWMRATVGYQRRYGRWQIVPETSQAAFTLEP
jgi:ketosteroid isomerase-like protein